ncbi:MAG: hypothetical protein GF334_03725 [Candidatus Altiarchaeales archaeon]|nr:hypothetical protein [Candidatus Altiarchaeales archaeon]
MCGIATIAVGRDLRKRVPYEKLRALTQELMLELRVRGEDASGISVINEDECLVYKKPLRPTRFVVRPRFQDMLEKIGPRTNFVLLHSRQASVGNNESDLNNHPIIAEPVLGIHNGTLYNDISLFKKHKKDFEADSDVDSEVIFKLLRMHLERGVSPKRALQKTTKVLDGAFTGAAVDMRNPGQMLMFRYGRQLSLFRVPHYDMVITTSESSFFYGAMRKVGMNPKSKQSVPADGTGLFFDVNAGEITDHLEDFALPVKWENYKRVREFNAWTHFAG